MLTVISATTIYNNLNSRILVLEIDGEPQSVVFSLNKFEHSTENSFSGELLITDLEGKFLKGYKIENNNFLVEYKQPKEHSSTINTVGSRTSSDCLNECPFSVCAYCDLDEVVIEEPSDPSPTPSIPITTIYPDGSGGGNENCEAECYGWDYEGGSNNPSNPNCEENEYFDTITNECDCIVGYTRDKDQKCVKIPCTNDPVPNPQIAPQTNSGIQGGLHDTCARRNSRTSCKGIRGRKWHNGVDIKNPFGAPIYAVFGGTATKHTQKNTKTGKISGAGHYISITSNVDGKTVRIVYFHLQENDRITGTVNAGDIIGYQGDSGNLKSGIEKGYTESHVHIKAQENGNNVDPLDYFKTRLDSESGQLLDACL